VYSLSARLLAVVVVLCHLIFNMLVPLVAVVVGFLWVAVVALVDT
tara:strand:+ start:45 stop:179 length:135 start_codon:yes stop_codon:yes gene_type:complete